MRLPNFSRDGRHEFIPHFLQMTKVSGEDAGLELPGMALGGRFAPATGTLLAIDLVAIGFPEMIILAGP